MKDPENSLPAPTQGLFFEELEVGQEYLSPGRTVTEADIVNFAGISGDYTSLHTDAEYVRRTPFRNRIAHGILVQAIATGLMTRTGIFERTILGLTDMVIHWRSPVFIGDTIRMLLSVAGKDENPSKRSGQVHFATQVLNQDDRAVAEGEWWALMARERADAQDRSVRRSRGNNRGAGS